MSEENVEVVRRVFAKWAVGDFSEGDAFHPDVEFDMADWPEKGKSQGLEGMRRLWLGALDPWVDLRAEALEFVEIGEHVVVPCRIRGRGRGSGALVDADTATVWTMEGGKIVRLALYWDGAKAFEAAGGRD